MPATHHSSPSGELPFLIQPTSPPEIVPLHKLHQLVVSKFKIPFNARATVYLNLVDTKIHAAWVPSISDIIDPGLCILLDRGIRRDHCAFIIHSKWPRTITIPIETVSPNPPKRRTTKTIFNLSQLPNHLRRSRRRLRCIISITRRGHILLQ